MKRAFDVVASAAGLVALSPILLTTSIAIRLTMGPPVMFRQRRGGLNGTTFELLKFRTMTEARDPAGHLLSDDTRLNAVGRFIRRVSVDELPQLWNVLRGDMSIVGPRPFFARYLRRYNAEQARRHNVRPGITGWAQVNGRNALTWEEKFAFDVWYVDHWSLSLDAKILALTALRVFRRRGISSEGHATMPEFMGSEGGAA